MFCVEFKVGDVIDLKNTRGHFALKVKTFDELGTWYVRAKDDVFRYPEYKEWLLRIVEDTFRYYSVVLRTKS